VFLGIQVIPVSGRSNPPVQTQIHWNNPEAENLARAACYDCHSNETVWPWYAYVAPISWRVADDVVEGREKLNFSLQTADQIDPRELAEEIEEGAMPPANFIMLHPEANLTQAQKQELIAGFNATFSGAEDEEGGEHDERENQEGEQRETEMEERTEADES